MTVSIGRYAHRITALLAALCLGGFGSALSAQTARSTLLVVPWLLDAAHERPAPDGEARWQFIVTPYVWASGLKGTVGVRDRTAEVNVTFKKLLEHLEGAFMLPVEARRGRWGIALEVVYVKLEDRSATPGPLFSAARLTASQGIFEGGPRLRVLDTNAVAVDLLAGARWWKLSNTLTLSPGMLPGIELNLDKGWIDPLAGARVFITLSPRLKVQARGDVGGFGVSSDFSWQALGALVYQLNTRFTLRAGYRRIDVDYDDDTGFIYDVRIRGPIVGVSISF